MILGIDVSTYFEMLEANAKYKINGDNVDPLELFAKQGITHMRIRVWNNPYKDNAPYLGGTCDINNFLKLCELCKKYNFKIILDLHYSDFWADPGKQMCPKAWVNLSFDEIVDKVYEFTKEVLTISKEKHIDIEYIQIGNEITNGMIWPYGKLDEKTFPRTGYDRLTTLLKSGIKAAKEMYPEIKTIIHLERSYDQVIYREYFDNLVNFDVDFDIIGMSYYPYWHGTFDDVFANVEMCKNTYHKEVMIMELGYGFTLEDYILNNNGDPHLVIHEKSDLLAKIPYPISKEGQAKFVSSFLRLAKEHNVLGVVYWEPLWIPGENICWASTEGQEYINEVGKSQRNEWANQCLFDYNGDVNPAFFLFKKED